MGYDAYSIKKLNRQGHNLERDDDSMVNYARENGMILVTQDKKCGKNCKAAGIPCILLDDDDLFKVILMKLAEYCNPAEKD